MGLIVQKYGGTSVGSAERIRAVAERVLAANRQGHKVVVVVSAMGDTTDTLISLARQVTNDPDEREMDLLLSTGEIISCTLLAMALRSLGQEAVSFTGAQAGIRTDGIHSRARIVAIDPARIIRELKRDRVAIVAGFQGVTDEHDITTLGRGGSDTTAVALAARLDAETCEIYTDVDGVFTADPRLVPEARKLDRISYDEMLELAQQGAKVMHPRAVELGAVHEIPIVVRSSFNDRQGTLICGGEGMEASNKVRGIAHDVDIAKITVIGVPDEPGAAATVFEPLAEAHISVDTIVQNASLDGTTDLSFTVSEGDLAKAVRLVEPVAARVRARGVANATGLAKVSIVGTGIQHAPGYAARMFRALAGEGINIDIITTSEIRITCLVAREHLPAAVGALHRAFELERAEKQAITSS
ncbi:MAG: aspartate kinase [Chloroflexi bacterium]|nr:aspartate kinase [Chloroflexota bacterium]